MRLRAAPVLIRSFDLGLVLQESAPKRQYSLRQIERIFCLLKHGEDAGIFMAVCTFATSSHPCFQMGSP